MTYSILSHREVVNRFTNYVSKFDMNNPRVFGKYKHSFNVADNCGIIASQIGLSRDDIELSWLIGILHDIGRFQQVVVANSFHDSKSFSHANYGCKLLFEDGLISKFCILKDWYSYIEKAVRYHSVYDLPNSLTEREKMFCNIIRDADKISIFQWANNADFELFHECTEKDVQTSLISDGVYQCLIEKKMIPYTILKSYADYFMRMYGFYFGIVYSESFQLLETQGYFYNLLNFKFNNAQNQERFDNIKEKIMEHQQYMLGLVK